MALFGNVAHRAARPFRLTIPVIAALAVAVTATVTVSRPAQAAYAPRVVIVVGPSGSATSDYLSHARVYARQARAYGAAVTEIYTPHATWGRVVRAVQGANLLIYLGHGNGWPSPYRPYQGRTKNGLGLNPSEGSGNTKVKYYGEDFVAAHIRLAPGAIVLLNRLCYASGNGEPGMAEPSWSTAVKRVDNYAAGFLRTGANAVVADGHTSLAYELATLFGPRRGMSDLWAADPDANGNVRGQLDPDAGHAQPPRPRSRGLRLLPVARGPGHRVHDRVAHRRVRRGDANGVHPAIRSIDVHGRDRPHRGDRAPGRPRPPRARRRGADMGPGDDAVGSARLGRGVVVAFGGSAVRADGRRPAQVTPSLRGARLGLLRKTPPGSTSCAASRTPPCARGSRSAPRTGGPGGSPPGSDCGRPSRGAAAKPGRGAARRRRAAVPRPTKATLSSTGSLRVTIVVGRPLNTACSSLALSAGAYTPPVTSAMARSVSSSMPRRNPPPPPPPKPPNPPGLFGSLPMNWRRQVAVELGKRRRPEPDRVDAQPARPPPALPRRRARGPRCSRRR